MGWLSKVDKIKSKGSTADYYKIKDGENNLRFFTFQHHITQADFELQREDPTKTKIGDVTDQGFLVVRKHFNPYSQCGKVKSLVTGKRFGQCDVCDLSDELIASKDPKDQGLGKKRQAQEFYAFVAIDLDVTPYKFVIVELSRTNALSILTEETIAQKKGKTLFGFGGRDICIRYNPKETDNRAKYKIYPVDTTEMKTIKPSDIQEPTVPNLYSMKMFAPEAYHQYFPDVVEAPVAAAPKAVEAAPAPTPAPAPAKVKKAPAAKAKPAWPPIVDQRVRVAFGDEKKDGTVTEVNAPGDDGTQTWSVAIDGDETYSCTLEEMEPIA